MITKFPASGGGGGGGGGGTPGGSDTSIQFKNGSSFDGFGAWDGTNLSVEGGFRPTNGGAGPTIKAADFSADYTINLPDSAPPIDAVKRYLGNSGNGTDYYWYTIAKGDVGLGNVDNTADLDKPISTATQTALDLKANASAISNIDNTSDANKPVSTAQQTALDAKLDKDFLFGSGQDGALTISSGTTTLDRDRYYSSITITGTAKLSTAGFRVFCSGTLNLSAAPAGAIEDVTTNGSSASVAAAGAQAGALTAAELGRGNRGVVGVAGGTTTGTAGTAGGATAVALCQVPAGQGGAGGLGASGAGGARGAAPTITARKVAYTWTPNLIRGVALASGGTNGSAGGSGGGDGTAGGGSGASGSGGGVVYIAAHTISRGGSTAAGAIRALGGNGGNGGTPAGGNRGGGGGGAGGTGGYVQIVYGALTGSTATNAIDVSGGAGGNGGTGLGTGVGGGGGDGGPGGVIVLVDATSGAITTTLGTALVAGGTASGTTAGTGSAGQVTRTNL